MPNAKEVLGDLDSLVLNNNWAADKTTLMLGKYGSGYKLIFRVDNRLISLYTDNLVVASDATTNDWFNNSSQKLVNDIKSELAAIGLYADCGDSLVDCVKDLIANYSELDKSYESYFETMRQIDTELDHDGIQPATTLAKIQQLVHDHNFVANELSNSKAENKELQQDLKTLADEFDTMDNEYTELANSYQMVNKQYGKLNQKYRELERLYNDAAKRVKRLNGIEDKEIIDRLSKEMTRNVFPVQTDKLSGTERASIQRYCDALRKVAKSKLASEDETLKIDSDGGIETLFSATITSGNHKILGHDGVWTWRTGSQTGNA